MCKALRADGIEVWFEAEWTQFVKPISSRCAWLVPATIFTFVCSPSSVAQTSSPVSPEAIALTGDRIESLLILGQSNGISGGAYTGRGAVGAGDIGVNKLGGGGDIGDPRPLSNGGLKWNPTIEGNIGYITGHTDKAALSGGTLDASMFGVSLGGGARIWFSDHFSWALGLGGIYAHTKETVSGLSADAQSSIGLMQQSGPIDWSIDTWSIVPSTDVKYLWNMEHADLILESAFDYFHTESFKTPAPAINLNGNSQTWQNSLDLDVPLGLNLFGYELHTGGHLDRTDLFGNVRTGLDTEHLYTVNARLVLDTRSIRSWLTWLGLGASYTWGVNLSGWSVGIDARVKL